MINNKLIIEQTTIERKKLQRCSSPCCYYHWCRCRVTSLANGGCTSMRVLIRPQDHCLTLCCCSSAECCGKKKNCKVFDAKASMDVATAITKEGEQWALARYTPATTLHQALVTKFRFSVIIHTFYPVARIHSGRHWGHLLKPPPMFVCAVKLLLS